MPCSTSVFAVQAPLVVANTASLPTGIDRQLGMRVYQADTSQEKMWNGTTWDIMSADGTWTPTLTNVAIGTGGSAGNTGAYSYTRGVLTVDIAIVLGTSAASVSGAPSISLPTGFTLARVSSSIKSSVNVSFIAGGSYFGGVATHTVGTALQLLAANSAGTYEGRTAITNLVPGTWAAGDAMFVNGSLKGTLV